MPVCLVVEGQHTEHITLSDALFALCLFFQSNDSTKEVPASVFDSSTPTSATLSLRKKHEDMQLRIMGVVDFIPQP